MHGPTQPVTFFRKKKRKKKMLVADIHCKKHWQLPSVNQKMLVARFRVPSVNQQSAVA